jgi:transcription elongation GreA/GreB family factor
MPKVFLTNNSRAKVTEELEALKKVQLPLAKKEVDIWLSYGDTTCTKEAKGKYKYIKQRIIDITELLANAELVEG